MASDFQIKKGDDVVATVKADGRVVTDDEEIIGLITIGVVASIGGPGKAGRLIDGVRLVEPTKDESFFGHFITELLDRGYTVPQWVTQALAR